MQTSCGKKTIVIKEDYYLKQIFTLCLAQYSYYIESEKEAIIIDPLREPDIYDEILNERGSKLKYILETHFHADFISGHFELAHKYNAEIVYGPTAKTEFKIKAAKDGEYLELGKIKIKIIHTPGHTLESSSYLLIDSKGNEECVVIGDTIFLGEVGRPDLAVKEGITESDLAGMLYESVQKIKDLNDNVIIYPGHGAGSACGKNISAGDYDTLSNQKNNNYAFNPHLTKQEFVEFIDSSSIFLLLCHDE
jgi:glyoxylase-like metal-dependent hydrolase (beta-lactamase superfamily II)